MNVKKLQLLVSVASVTFVSMASAQMMNGSVAVAVDIFHAPTSSWTASTLTLDATNYVTGTPTGSFASVVPTLGTLTADSVTISGLSTSPVADNIHDFFFFSGAGGGFGASGTTPNNRFDFNLATITDVGGGVFTGTGTLVDTLGTYANTPGEFTLSFPDGDGTYSFTLAAVPEPTTISLLAVGLFGMLTIRRRKV
jgi:hypothetical protein